MTFFFQNDLTNIVYDNTCFKNPENPTCIDLFLTNFPRSFQNTIAVTTGLSDFHKMTVTVLKNNFCKPKPKTVYYRCYKTFYSNVFRKELKEALIGVSNYLEFLTIYLRILDIHAPMKMKSVRANKAPYMTKALSFDTILSKINYIIILHQIWAIKSKVIIAVDYTKKKGKVL